jgi:hypothetical protein
MTVPSDTVPASPDALRRAAEKFGLLDVPISDEADARLQEVTAAPAPRVPLKQRLGVQVRSSPYDLAKQMMAHKPPPAWERQLWAISPRSDRMSWLTFAWKDSPDKLDKNLGRWVLYECIPEPLIKTDLHIMLNDRPYWELPEGKQHGRALFVSAYQWIMYREQGVYAQPFWVIQGSHGGTPVEYSPFEKRLLALKGLPTTPPPRGALPYAPWDRRAERAVMERNVLAKYQGSVARLKESMTAEGAAGVTAAEDREVRRQLVEYWNAQLDGESDYLAWYMKKSENQGEFRKQTHDEYLAMKKFEEQYIDTGEVGSLPGDWTV